MAEYVNTQLNAPSTIGGYMANGYPESEVGNLVKTGFPYTQGTEEGVWYPPKSYVGVPTTSLATPPTASPVGAVGQFMNRYLPNFTNGLKQDYNNVKQGFGQDVAETKRTMGQVANNWNQMSIGERANTILGTVGSVMQAYNGYKAGKLAQKQYDHAVNAFNKNWEAQRQSHNVKLEDRQQRRVLEGNASGRAVTSVGDYMNKWGVR